MPNPSQFASPAFTSGLLAWTNFGSSGPGVSINANGNSGSLTLAPFARISLLIAILTAPTGTTPTLTITLNGADQAGNLYSLGVTSALNSVGQTLLEAGPGLTNNHVIPLLGTVSWVVGGTTPVFPNVEMTLIGR